MLGAFTFLLAMLIPNVDVGDMDLGIYGGHLVGELCRLFLASMLSIFIYVIFFEILNQALLWIAPLHYAALLDAIHQKNNARLEYGKDNKVKLLVKSQKDII